jgi:hypothetical protein
MWEVESKGSWKRVVLKVNYLKIGGFEDERMMYLGFVLLRLNKKCPAIAEHFL